MRAKSEEEDGIEYVQSNPKGNNSIIISTLFIVSIFFFISFTRFVYRMSFTSTSGCFEGSNVK